MEWCNDWWSESYYAESADIDPAGPTDGRQRVVRGGSFSHFAADCRSAARLVPCSGQPAKHGGLPDCHVSPGDVMAACGVAVLNWSRIDAARKLEVIMTDLPESIVADPEALGECCAPHRRLSGDRPRHRIHRRGNLHSRLVPGSSRHPGTPYPDRSIHLGTARRVLATKSRTRHERSSFMPGVKKSVCATLPAARCPASFRHPNRSRPIGARLFPRATAPSFKKCSACGFPKAKH